MLTASERTALQLVSLVEAGGELEISLASVAVPHPAPDEVVLRVDAAPINPSDLGLMLAGVDAGKLAAGGTADRPVLTGRIASTASLAGRLGQPLPAGIEGAGSVVEAGSSPAAQALRGRIVAAAPGSGMYAEYRVLRVDQCLALNPGSTAFDGASACINPLTALGFLETMRREGHTALANTAAASNLGQMLVRLCLRDGIALVNIVRSVEQAQLLIASELTRTFASSHAKKVSLAEALRLPALTAYGNQVLDHAERAALTSHGIPARAAALRRWS